MRTENDCGTNTAAWTYPAVEHLTTRAARLVRTVEAEIVPRLMLMRRSPQPRVATPADETAKLTDQQDVIELTRLLLAHDVAVASAFVHAVLQRGDQFQQICLELLAPAARRLGVMWENDECDFMQVTLGLCRLHQVLHQLNSANGILPENDLQEHARRVLIAPLPGEQHTFGVIMVSQFLRVAGWDVCNEFPHVDGELADLVHDRWFAVAGLSVGSQAHLPGISGAIKSIRQASLNKAICVLVGGPIFVGHPELASVVGADATASDGKDAVQVAETMFASLVASR
jgi:MerR family transcriptional regulator, light-induced transcriptional regulator